MRHLKTTLAVLGAATILVLAGNSLSLAATGHAFILGKSNSAHGVTSLKRATSGPALKVTTKKAANPPFQVNGSGKVTHLNADQLDGYDSSQLRTSSYAWSKAVTVASVNATFAVSLPAGDYLIGYSAYLSNGGAAGSAAGCYVSRSHPASSTEYYAEEHSPTVAGVSPSFSGSDLVHVLAGDTLHLYCYAPSAFTTLSTEPIRMHATRTTVVGGGALRVVAPRVPATH